MLIPGVPPAGAQQEVFKPDRQPRTTAAEGLAHDPLADLPVEQQTLPQHHGQHAGDQPAPEQQAQSIPAEAEAATAPGSPDLPRKGLLVDIRA